MRHCCKFKPDDIYYLKETNLYIYRMFTIGFCPICGKPVAELYRVRFDGIPERICESGIEANELMSKISEDILYSMKQLNYKKFKSKPFGWKYGVNKSVKRNGRADLIKQYACDFYGNKELVKTL
ncbi:hypothetical protein IJ750_01465 [bacterium]|nr:hypothetical protein [bacterium]